MGSAKGKVETNTWAPHIWLGCDLFAWLRLLWLGRYSFGWKHVHLLPLGTIFALGHTFLRYAQQGFYGQRLRESSIQEPPLFILGHWRSGTTLLHELLVLDPRHSFPNTYQCFDPSHFLISENFIRKFFNWILPSQRMMDNMPVGWGRPQEEEFALALLGQPSPYNTIAFPNRGWQDGAALNLDGLPKWQKANWKRAFLRFLKEVAYRDPRRLVLKSPPHTCRIPTLLEMFPDARFIHIVRDPVAVFSSTVNLWKKMYRAQGMHEPTFEGLEDRVFQTFLELHQRLDDTRGLIRPDRFHELRYEDLVRDPMSEMRKIYVNLDLGEFEHVRAELERYLAENAGYERNKFQPSAEEIAEITRRWGDVMRQYGYLEVERRAAS